MVKSFVFMAALNGASVIWLACGSWIVAVGLFDVAVEVIAWIYLAEIFWWGGFFLFSAGLVRTYLSH